VGVQSLAQSGAGRDATHAQSTHKKGGFAKHFYGKKITFA
jgi:hypothetical protein